MNKIKYISIGIVTFLIFLSVGILIKNQLKPTPAPLKIFKVKIGYMPFTTNWPVMLAYKNGLFKKEGLDVTLVKFSSGVLGADSLIKGDLAAFSVNTFTDIFNIQARTPGALKMYTFEQNSDKNHIDALLVKKGSSIKTVNDLKGKKIGILPGTFVQTMITQSYKGILDFSKDTILVKIAPALQLQALQTGQIDALSAQEPLVTIATQRNIAEVLDPHPLGRIAEPFPIGGFTLSTKVEKSNPEIIRRIVKAYKEATLLGRQNQQEVKNAVLDIIKLTPEEITLLKYDEVLLGYEIKPDALRKTAELYYNLGFQKTVIDTNNMLYVLKDN